MHFPHDNQGQTQLKCAHRTIVLLGRRIESLQELRQQVLGLSERMNSVQLEGFAPGFEVPTLLELAKLGGKRSMHAVDFSET